MAKPENIQHTLDKLADTFQSHFLPAQGASQGRGDNAPGWGQFLDSARNHRQVGIYGTAAGASILALAGRNAENLTLQEAANTLAGWWNDAEPRPSEAQKFSQLLRIAFFYLAVRLVPDSRLDTCRETIRSELERRILPEGMWGDWWISETRRDSTPRILSSSIALICCTLLATELNRSPFSAVATALESRLKAASQLPRFDAVLASTAVLCAKGPDAAEHVQRLVRNLAYTVGTSITSQHVYFYDFEQPTSTTRIKPIGRDYYLVSPGIMLGIAGFQEGAHWLARVRAEYTSDDLIAHLASNGGLYIADTGERVSTVNQAWAALLLAAARDSSGTAALVSRPAYVMLRERTDNWFIKYVWRPSAVIAAAAGPVLVGDADLQSKAVVAVASLLIGAVYGQKVILTALSPVFRRV